MIKIFRKIRLKILGSSKVSSYFIYALGEILLVVIGILIALQINNWNEERKDLEKYRKILLEIQENVQYNSSLFEAEIKEEYSVIKSIDIVLENMNEIKVYNDSLSFHIFNCGYWPASSKKSSGYESLKSQGINLIGSTSLTESIIDLYEKTYNELSEIVRLSEANSQNTIVPIFTDLFIINPSYPGQAFEELGATPVDYNQLLQSTKFRAVLGFWRHSRVVGIDLRIKAIEKNKEMEKAIAKALQK